MSNANVNPEILDGLDYEHQFIQRTSGAQRRIVKLNRGDSWLLRFIPAKLGPNGRWYARIAKHWVNQRAIICPRHTEEAYGGHPEAYCSVCELSAHLNDERHEEVSKFGFKLRATPNWVTYCAVFEKAANGGLGQAQSLPEVLQPYEFAHYKTSWEELTGFVKAGVRRNPNSVLDWVKGNDFAVSKTNKGLRLDKQDSGPIFNEDDPQFEENCQKLLAACKDPVVKIPDEQAMDTFADKAQEEANNIARGRTGGTAAPGGRGARQARDEDDLPPDDQPARGGRSYAEPQQEATPARARAAAAPAAASAASPRRAAAPPQEPAPVRRAAAAPAAAAAPLRRAAAPPPPQPEPEQEAPPEDNQGEGDLGAEGDQQPVDEGGDQPAEEQQQEAEPAPAPARRATAAPTAAPATARPAASRPSAQRQATAAPARTAAPAPARAPARGTGAPVAQESIDENEHIPEEANDQAPPAALLDPADDPGAGEAPPPVDSTRRGQFAANIKGKIAAANASVKK
jgi:hypothetical protein